MALPSPSPDATVVVTGASAGIGSALARTLAARGHGVTLVARREEVLHELADELRDEHGTHVRVLPADLADEGGRRELLDALDQDPRIVSGLCNNAGVGGLGRVVDHDLADERRLVALNVAALHDLTAAMVGPMVARGEGAILNVGSILAFAPQPKHASYAATKAFVSSFSEALHSELAGTGVSCTVVSPGPVRTDIYTASGADEGAAGRVPGLLWQDPDEVAKAAVDAMQAGNRSVIPGLTNKLAVLGYRYVPRTPFLPLARAVQGLLTAS